LIIVTATLITVLGALAFGEARARESLSARVAVSAPDGVVVAPAGIVVWGLVTGSVPVTLTIYESAIAAAIAENVTEEQASQIQDVRIDDFIYVDLLRETPIGEVPIEVAVRPTISDGALTTQIVSVTAGGFGLPTTVLSGVSLSPGSDLVGSKCLTLRDARVESDTVQISADAVRGCQ
jgi:hypothetical protein